MRPAADRPGATTTSERRSTDLHARLPTSWVGPGGRHSRAVEAPVEFIDPDTGFYTGAALAEFIQYEIDGAAQTDRNELYITPLCLAACAVDMPGAKDEERARAHDAAVIAIRLFTRAADRIGVAGNVFLLLLRRTLVKNVHDTYAPRLAETVTGAIRAAGLEATLSVGVTSLVEHAARSPDDMVRKAMRALEEARKNPGSAVVYDFRVMPLK